MAADTRLASQFAVAPWNVTETEFLAERYPLGEGVLALANGYLGLRASFEEGLCFANGRRGHYLAGVFDGRPHPTYINLVGCPDQPREIVNLPDFTCLRLFVDGDLVDLGACQVDSYRRTLHLDRGLLERQVELTMPTGARLRLHAWRFVSRRRLHVAALRLRLEVLNRPAPLALESGIDGRVHNANGVGHLRDLQPEADKEGMVAMRCRTAESGIDIAIFLHDCLSNADSVCDASAAKNQFAGLWHEAVLRTGEPADFTRLVAVASTAQGADGQDAAELAWQELQAAIELGFDGLLAEQQAAWQSTWEEIGLQVLTDRGAAADLAWQQGLNYALFQILQYAPAGRLVAARGLVNEVAGGAYAWDVDVFTIPTLALLAPEAAKSAVRQRLATLPAARQKAEALGIDGAAFPWLADADGQETCPLWQFSLLSLHPTAAVAWGLCFTVEITGDFELLVDGGLELLVETARFWCLRVHRPEGSGETHLRGVVGLDEYHQGVDNDYYTNAMVRWQLKATVACFRQLERKQPDAVAALRQRLDVDDAELARFLALAASLRLPTDDRQGIHLQFDGFLQLEPCELPEGLLGRPLDETWSYDRLLRSRLVRRSGVVAAGLLLEVESDDEQLARDFDYYDRITTHDSPLSLAQHAIVAARLGRLPKASEYFARLVRLDLDDRQGNAQQGPHLACLAGLWQVVVFGFGGLRCRDGQLAISPRLPQNWRQVAFSLHWRGVRLAVAATHAELTLSTDGGSLALAVDGRPVEVGPTPIRLARTAA